MKTATQDVPVTMRGTQPKPTTRFMNPFDELDEWLEGMFQRPMTRPLADRMALRNRAFGGRTPHVDVVDMEDEIVVKAELPGVAKEDVEISATDNTLTIRATTNMEDEDDTGDYYRCEIVRGEYSRTIALPSHVDGAKAGAKLKDGLLEVSLPKVEKAKRQKISLK